MVSGECTYNSAAQVFATSWVNARSCAQAVAMSLAISGQKWRNELLSKTKVVDHHHTSRERIVANYAPPCALQRGVSDKDRRGT